VTSAAELSSPQTTIRGRFGDVDVLAAFVGGLGSPVPVLDITEDQWRNTVNTDLTGKFLTVRTFASAMKEKRSGNIILMSSAAGRLVSQASAAYAASEAGTLMRQQVLHAASGRLRKKVSGKLASNSQYL